MVSEAVAATPIGGQHFQQVKISCIAKGLDQRVAEVLGALQERQQCLLKALPQGGHVGCRCGVLVEFQPSPSSFNDREELRVASRQTRLLRIPGASNPQALHVAPEVG